MSPVKAPTQKRVYRPKHGVQATNTAVARLGQIKQGYAACRDYQHSWTALEVEVDKRRQEIHRIMKCRVCPMERDQVLDMDGTIKAGRTRYWGPKDYYLKGGQMTKEERGALRLLNAGLL